MTETTSPRYIGCADTARLLRQALRAEFPGVTFSVRSDTYAGGASIRVRWTDGPTEDEVRGTTYLYAGATFDGMTDSKDYRSTVLVDSAGNFESVHFGADFVFTRRDLTDAYIARFLSQVRPNGHSDRPSQCGVCGNWMPAGDLWHADVTGTTCDFVCSPACGARLYAGNTSESEAGAR